MRAKTGRIAATALIAVAASLLVFVDLAPESDPAWWLLGGLHRPLPKPAEVLLLDAPPDTTLSPGELALDIRDLAEFDAGPLLVDLPVDWSAGDTTPVDSLARLRVSIDAEFGKVSVNLKNFWLGLRSGSLRAADASSGFSAIEDILASSKERLLEGATPDSTQLPSLESALSIHPDVWFGMGLRPLPGSLSDAESAWLASCSLSSSVSMPLALRLPEIAGIEIPPPQIVKESSGSGFSLRDEAGARHSPVFPMGRFLPLASYQGSIIPHPSLLILARHMRASGIQLEGKEIRLINAHVFRGGIHDVIIPLDHDGKTLLGRVDFRDDWPRRLPLSTLDDYRAAEAKVVEKIGALERAGLLVDRAPPTELWRGAAAFGEALLSPGEAVDSAQAGEDGAGASEASGKLEAWRAAKAAFFEAAAAALGERSRMDELLAGLAGTPGLSESAREGVQSLRDRADRAFAEASTALQDWQGARATMMRELGGSLVVMGLAPHRSRGGFEPAKGAPPVDPSGDIAAFLRTGLTASFITPVGAATSFPIALTLALALSLLLAIQSPRGVFVVGLFVAFALFAFSALAYREAEIWWSPSIIALVCLLPGTVGFLGRRVRMPVDPAGEKSKVVVESEEIRRA